MSSTNKTTNYELSQFIGSDKPAWLTDYNSDMSKIDAGVHSAQTTATGADGKATANTTAIGTLASLTTTAKTDLVSAVNEVDLNADTAQNTANTANTTANIAKTTADNLAAYFTISPSATEVSATVDKGTAGSGNYNKVRIHKNSSGSLVKIYGEIDVSNLRNTSGSLTVTVADTGLRPESAITITGCGWTQYMIDNRTYTGPLTYTINIDGTITINVSNAGLYDSANFYFIACVIFLEDFGDND